MIYRKNITINKKWLDEELQRLYIEYTVIEQPHDFMLLNISVSSVYYIDEMKLVTNASTGFLLFNSDGKNFALA